MRLLITNPWNGQAYCLLRHLRPHASRLVVTTYREHGLLGRLAPAAVSRFVDRTYPVPLVAGEWHRGVVRERNSEQEERYVRAVLDICERERLDAVFPSWDPEVFLLSRNKPRFAERGIAVPVPEWPVVQRTMDKYALIREAEALGFPAPRTRLPGSPEEAPELAREVGFPLVIKPRFSAGARGTHLVTGPAALEAAIRRVEPAFGMPILQEWIPGGQDHRVSVSLTLDGEGRLLSVQARRIVRAVFDSFSSVPAVMESCDDAPWTADAVRLVRGLGYVGHARVQLKVDPRDGRGKLLEINCRPGFLVWCEMAAGQDVPLLCLRIERGEPVEPLEPLGGPRVFLSPIEDTISLVATLLGWGRRALAGHRRGPAGDDRTLGAILAAHRRPYGAPWKLLDWYFRALGDDPLAGLAWYGSHLLHVLREPKRLPAAGRIGQAPVEPLGVPARDAAGVGVRR